jgi:hypothetical protein
LLIVSALTLMWLKKRLADKQAVSNKAVTYHDEKSRVPYPCR